ncbi:unnamed protein product [Prorocentrum cordatum]|uniref:Peptidase M14 domain-containing protein n=1 Tax=Prorocentrum cordatum TaxID=2364126 RepID=A0ABN9PQD4_9DINO|nr:unnamed protein product [Polarella glacialis]
MELSRGHGRYGSLLPHPAPWQFSGASHFERSALAPPASHCQRAAAAAASTCAAMRSSLVLAILAAGAAAGDAAAAQANPVRKVVQMLQAMQKKAAIAEASGIREKENAAYVAAKDEFVANINAIVKATVALEKAAREHRVTGERLRCGTRDGWVSTPAALMCIGIARLGESLPPRTPSRAHDPYRMFDNSSILLVEACGRNEEELLMREIEDYECTPVETVSKTDACSVMAVICPKLFPFKHGEATAFNDDAGAYLRGAGYPQAWDRRSSRTDFYTQWRDYDDLVARLQDVVDAAPGVAVLEDLEPATHEGRSIKAVRIRGSAWTAGAPRIVINCLLHAREWMASMVGTYLAEYSVDRQRNDPSWLAGMELVIVPISNPDGLVFSQTSNAMWRKNRATNAGYSCKGVDLNRNWAKDWSGVQTTSTYPCSDLYVGASSMSEPETQALAALLTEAPVKLHLDIHSHGAMILGPWAYTNADHPDKTTIDAIGMAMYTAIKSVNGQDYIYGTGDAGGSLYLCSGVAPDFSTDLGAYGYTIELPPAGWQGSAGFQPDTSEILPACTEIFEAVQVMVAWFKVKVGVEKGLAVSSGLGKDNVGMVEATLSLVTSRRLSTASRQLSGFSVQVQFEIIIPSEASQSIDAYDVADSLSSADEDSLSTALSDAIASVADAAYHVEVAELPSVELIVTPVPAPTPLAPTPAFVSTAHRPLRALARASADLRHGRRARGNTVAQRSTAAMLPAALAICGAVAALRTVSSLAFVPGARSARSMSVALRASETRRGGLTWLDAGAGFAHKAWCQGRQGLLQAVLATVAVAFVAQDVCAGRARRQAPVDVKASLQTLQDDAPVDWERWRGTVPRTCAPAFTYTVPAGPALRASEAYKHCAPLLDGSGYVGLTPELMRYNADTLTLEGWSVPDCGLQFGDQLAGIMFSNGPDRRLDAWLTYDALGGNATATEKTAWFRSSSVTLGGLDGNWRGINQSGELSMKIHLADNYIELGNGQQLAIVSHNETHIVSEARDGMLATGRLVGDQLHWDICEESDCELERMPEYFGQLTGLRQRAEEAGSGAGRAPWGSSPRL